MNESQPPPTDAAPPLAAVISLTAANRDRAGGGDADRPEPAERGDDACAADIIGRRVGQRWPELPEGAAPACLRAEGLLVEGPTAIDPTTTRADEALGRARGITKALAALIERAGEEVSLLGEALAVDVAALPLARVHEVAQAVVGLSNAPRVVPTWAAPSEADSADVVLRVSEPHLREAARSHELLYGQFTEGIWEVSPLLLAAARRRWRLVARARLRISLRAVSRTRRLPGRLSRVAAEIEAARRTRSQLALVGPLLSHHLADLDRGPLTDIAAARASLSAVRDLQQALGEQLDAARLERLLRADAFRDQQIVGPAATVRSALEVWANDVTNASGGRAWDSNLDELTSWSRELQRALPVLAGAVQTAARIGLPAITVTALVDVLVLRDRLPEVRRPHGVMPAGRAAPAATEAHTTDHAWSAS